jgi:predicted protein tyrosine phosphatase
MKLLFVCSQNKLRSLTAEKIFKELGYSVRSAGTENNSRIKISSGDIGWADLIFVMEAKHKERLKDKFKDSLTDKKVILLNIPDKYKYMDPKLIEILKEKVIPYIDD